MANNNNAAYQQLRPTTDTLSSDIKFWAQNRAQKRREDKAQEQLSYNRDRQAKLDKQALYDKHIKPLNNYDTGSTSLNEIQGRLLQQATKQYIPLIKTLEDPNASDDDKLKAQLKLETLNQLPENLKTVTDFYTNQHNSYLKGKEDGSIWENIEYEKAFKDGFSNIQLGIDESGLPTVAFVDTDGDGVLDVQNYDQLKKGIPTFDFERKFNFEGAIADVAKKLGTVETKAQEGFKTTTTKDVDPQALDMVTNKIIESNIKSALREYGGLEGTPENMAKIKMDFKKEVLSRTDRSHKVEIDQSGITSRLRENRLSRKDDNKAPKLSTPTTPSNEIWDFKATNINPNKVNSIGVSGVKLPTVVGRDGTTYSNASVQNYTYNENGEMVLDVVIPKTKSISRTEVDELSPEQRENLSVDEKTGKTRITLPGENIRQSVIVKNEDEAKIHNKLGQSVEEGKEKAYKGEVQETKKSINGF